MTDPTATLIGSVVDGGAAIAVIAIVIIFLNFIKARDVAFLQAIQTITEQIEKIDATRSKDTTSSSQASLRMAHAVDQLAGLMNRHIYTTDARMDAMLTAKQRRDISRASEVLQDRERRKKPNAESD